jgi:hypothetical protein
LSSPIVPSLNLRVQGELIGWHFDLSTSDAGPIMLKCQRLLFLRSTGIATLAWGKPGHIQECPPDRTSIAYEPLKAQFPNTSSQAP